MRTKEGWDGRGRGNKDPRTREGGTWVVGRRGTAAARATFPSVLRQPKKAFFPSRVFPLATRPFLWLVATMKPTEEGGEEALQRRKNSIRPPPTHPVWDPIFRLLPCKRGLEDASSPPDEQKEETGTFFFSADLGSQEKWEGRGDPQCTSHPTAAEKKTCLDRTEEEREREREA